MIERLAIVAARKIEEETKHPDKIVSIYVGDMSDKKGNPKVRIVLKSKPKGQPVMPSGLKARIASPR